MSRELTPKVARQIAAEDGFRYFDTEFGIVAAIFEYRETRDHWWISDTKRFARFLESEGISHMGETKHLVRHGVV